MSGNAFSRNRGIVIALALALIALALWQGLSNRRGAEETPDAGPRSGAGAVAALRPSGGGSSAPPAEAPTPPPMEMAPPLQEGTITLTGLTRDQRNGAPVVAATLSIDSLDRTVLSNAEGNYRFDEMRPGVARVTVRAKGFIPLKDRMVSLAPGEDETVAHFDLVAAAVVEGRVEDRSGAPIPDAVLHIMDTELGIDDVYAQPIYRNFRRIVDNQEAGLSKLIRSEIETQERVPASTRSDEEGHFRFEWAPVGEPFNIQAVHPEYAVGDSRPLLMSAGEERRDIVIVLDAGATIMGTIRDEQGQPIAGARVGAVDAMAIPQGTLTAFSNVASIFIARQAADSVQSDSQGRYVIPRLAPGRYRVVASAEGYQYGISSDVELARDELAEGVNVVLRAGAMISGQVMGPDRAGLKNAYVAAIAPNLQQPEYDYTETDDGGHYQLKHLRPTSAYMLVAWADGYGWQLANFITPPREEMDFILEPDATIRGRVIDAVTKAPIPEFRIQPAPAGMGFDMYIILVAQLLEQGVKPSYPVNDPDGRFEISRLAAGDYRLTFTADGYIAKSEMVAGLQPNEIRGDLLIELTPGSGVEGVVVEAGEEGRPIPGARVTEGRPQDKWAAAMLEYKQNEAYTDQEGRFYIAGLPNGQNVSLFASAEGYVTDQVSAPVPVPEGETVVLRLKPSASLSGQVVAAPDDHPVAGASVFPGQGGLLGRPENAAQTDPDGRFLLHNVAPGSVRLTVRHPEYPEHTTDYFSAGIDGIVDVGRIRLAAPGGVRGGVWGADSNPIEGAQIMLVIGSSSHHTATDGAGLFTFPNVEPGIHQISMTEMVDINQGGLQRRGARQVQEVEVQAGQTAEVVFFLMAGSRLFGQVTSAGQPARELFRISMRALEAEFGMQQEYSVETEPGGMYMFENLAPGTYDLMLRRSTSSNREALLTRRVVIDEPEVQYDIALPESRIAGQVLDAQGQPVARARVEVQGMELPTLYQAPRTNTNNDGRFTFTSLPGGEYSLVARHQDHGYAAIDIFLEEGQQIQDVIISLGQPIPLEGLSLRAHLSPPGPASPLYVRLIDEQGREAFNDRVNVDAEGRYRIPSLVPGYYQLDAFTFTWTLGALALEAAPFHAPAVPVFGEPFNLTFQPGGALLVVVQAQGRPVSSARVVLTREDGGVVIWPGRDGVITNPEGMARLEHVPPGPHRVVVSRTGYETGSAAVNVAPGDVADVVVTLRTEAPPSPPPAEGE